ncbi:MAG TPA: PQQ-binding-like beta-propeller repeat protein, partial [Gemmataceae bacterium]|nr:PQQ-binding-like beta-propeller repeat protein [Gemmataceae bacterium]
MSITRRILSVLAILGLFGSLCLWNRQVQAQRRIRPPVDYDGMEEASDTGVSLPNDREAKRIIEAVNDYIGKKDWDVVARSLQYLLEKPEDSFFEVKRKKDDKEYTTRISIRVEANRLVGSLPPDGLETYRQKFGQAAKRMLQEGIDKNDPYVLSKVATQYLHTDSGLAALNLLGNYFLDRGNYQAASGRFRQMLDLMKDEKPEKKKEVEPKIMFKAALAFKRFGDSNMAEDIWKQLAELVKDKGLTIGKQTFTLEQLRAELDRHAELSGLTVINYNIYRGDPSRTAQGVGGTPFLEPLWKYDMINRQAPFGVQNSDWEGGADWVEKKIKAAQDVIGRSPQKNRAMLPGFFPIAAANRLIFRTYNGVCAVAIKDDPKAGFKAGELDWASPCDVSLQMMAGDASGRATLEGWMTQYYMQVGQILTGILFENAQVGTLSHDNQFVYVVEDMAVPPHPNMVQFGFNGNPAAFGNFSERVMFSKLKALDLQSGSLKWEIGEYKFSNKPMAFGPGVRPALVAPGGPGLPGAPKPPEAPKEEAPKPFVVPQLPTGKAEFVNAFDELKDSYFLGPPLPLGGKIYVLAENAGELRLVCMDPKNVKESKSKKKTQLTDGKTAEVPAGEGPEIVWMQPLGTASNKLTMDTLRRIQPAHLAYNDGILICPTNAGAIVAVDILSQSLAWAYTYRNKPQQPEPNAQGQQPGMPRGFRGDIYQQVNLQNERWYTSAPAISDGRVVFTAHDTNAVHCLSLRDGNELWTAPRAAGDLYMAGVFNGKVLIVGKDSIRALDLKDGGKKVWEERIGMPSGQGVAANNHYYLPLKNGVSSPEPEICAIDINTGKAIHTKSRRHEVPGNLLFYEGDIFSQGIYTVSAFPQLQSKLTEMNARLEKNPKDPVGLLDRGELRLDKGELVPAIADLRTALDCQPPAELRTKARQKLYEALTEIFQKDFNKAEEFLSLYQDLCLKEVSGEEKVKRQSNYLCLLGKGREHQGKLVDAFDAYMEFGQLNGGKELVPSIDEPGTMAAPDVWARGRILAMISKASPEQKKPLEERIARQWASVKDTGDLEKIRGFVKVFGSISKAGEEARLQLCEQLMTKGTPEDLRDAELQLDLLSLTANDRALAAQATEALARLMIRRGELRDAVPFYQKLGSEFADVKLKDGRTGAEIYNELITDKRLLPFLAPGQEVWNFRLRGELVAGANTVNGQNAFFTFVPDGELLPIFQRYQFVIDTNTPSRTNNAAWQLRMIDKITGEVVMKESELQPNYYLLNNNTAGASAMHHFAQARGHLLVLTLQHMVYAFDLVARKKLWEYNLFGENAFVNQNVQQTIQQPDGSMQIVYADGMRLRIGQNAVVESSYICLPERDGLVAVDPILGKKKKLWSKTMPTSGFLFGDATHVFIAEMGDDGRPGATKAVRAADGVTVPVPDFSKQFDPAHRLRIIGRNLLVFDDQDGKKVLRLYDVLTGKDVWKQEFAANSIALHSEDPSLAGALEPNGDVTVINLNTRKVVMKYVNKDSDPLAQLKPEQLANLQEVHLLNDRERFYLLLNKTPEQGVNVIPYVMNGLRSTRLHGTLVAFDREKASLEWSNPVENQWVLLDQFQDLPVIICTSHFTRFNNNGLERQEARIEAFDKKTGTLAIHPDRQKVTPNGQFYAMHTDPRTGIIELLRYDLKVR